MMFLTAMATNKKTNESGDDGRTIADMSGVERRSIIGGIVPENKERNVSNDISIMPTKEERMAYLKGVIAAVLLVTGIFILGIGLTILFLQLYWNGMRLL